MKLVLSELEAVTVEDKRRESLDTEEYHGHKNWSHWNVSLWIDNEYETYSHVRDIIKRHLAGQVKYNSFTKVCRIVQNSLPKNTPDGARYSLVAIKAYLEREIVSVKKYLDAKG